MASFRQGSRCRLGARELQRLLSAYLSLLVQVRSLALLRQRFGRPRRCPEVRAERLSLGVARKTCISCIPCIPCVSLHRLGFARVHSIDL